MEKEKEYIVEMYDDRTPDVVMERSRPIPYSHTYRESRAMLSYWEDSEGLRPTHLQTRIKEVS